MAHLLDTGVLLRLVNVQDTLHLEIKRAVRTLVARQEPLHITIQNIAEFWNVATRPSASNGLGWSTEVALNALTFEIEPMCSILTETTGLHAELKRLVAVYAVVGKQVHDARLAAMMLVSHVDRILTLNEGDFRRYEPEGIVVVTPDAINLAP